MVSHLPVEAGGGDERAGERARVGLQRVRVVRAGDGPRGVAGGVAGRAAAAARARLVARQRRARAADGGAQLRRRDQPAPACT